MLKHNGLILDTCCVMNLYASGVMKKVLSSLGKSIYISSYCLNEEALTVFSISKSASPTKKEKINLMPMINEGFLSVADLETEKEKTSFLDFASKRMDNGEASTMAIALHRDWAVATDDRLATRLFKNHYPKIQIVTTPELMKQWHDSAEPDPDFLCKALIDIENKANYILSRTNKFYSWWQSCTSGSGSDEN